MSTDADLELLESLLPDLPPPPPLEEKLHPTFQKFFEGKTHLKHPAQESSILGHLADSNLLSTDVLYIDLGAGKARIDEHIFRILVDRESFRACNRKDHKLKNKVRLNLDLSQLDPFAFRALLPEHFPRERCVVHGKHVCGGATDLALRFAAARPCPATALALATCCHRLTRLDEYVHPAYLAAAGVTAELFPLVAKASNWATLSLQPLPPDQQQLRNRKREMGKLSDLQRLKYFLDHGRMLWLEAQGFRVTGHTYTEHSVENFLILATPAPP